MDIVTECESEAKLYQFCRKASPEFEQREVRLLPFGNNVYLFWLLLPFWRC